jgi:hypothetical protein
MSDEINIQECVHHCVVLIGNVYKLLKLILIIFI